MPPENTHVVVADESTSSHVSRLMSYATLTRCVSEVNALAFGFPSLTHRVGPTRFDHGWYGMTFTTIDAAGLVSCDDVVQASRGTHMRGVPANGAYIKQARRSRGLTQEALADAAGCDIKTVYRAEQAARLDMATLARLADALRVPYRRVISASEDG
jgi:DNA-binding XRE family transcriptional regulator